MKRYSVQVAEVAKIGIREQLRYIADDSIDNALKWEDRLSAAIENIGRVPGYAVDEDASGRLGRVIHKMVFERTYLIHFVVDESVGRINVIGFRHGARRPNRGEP